MDFNSRFSMTQGLNRNFRENVVCTVKPSVEEGTFGSCSDSSEDRMHDSNIFRMKYTIKLSLSRRENENLPYTVEENTMRGTNTRFIKEVDMIERLAILGKLSTFVSLRHKA